MTSDTENDWVHHPSHYMDASGYECIQFTERMNCPNLANSFRYVWRAGKKWNDREDLEKAVFYVDREASLRKEWNRPLRFDMEMRRPIGHLPEDDDMFSDFMEASSGQEDRLRLVALSSIWASDMFAAGEGALTLSKGYVQKMIDRLTEETDV